MAIEFPARSTSRDFISRGTIGFMYHAGKYSKYARRKVVELSSRRGAEGRNATVSSWRDTEEEMADVTRFERRWTTTTAGRPLTKIYIFPRK